MLNWSNHEPRFTAAKMPTGMPIEDREDDGAEREFDGRGEAREELLNHRTLGRERGAEVAAAECCVR